MQSTKERPYTSSSKHRSQFHKKENDSSVISLWQVGSHLWFHALETKRRKRRRSRCQH